MRDETLNPAQQDAIDLLGAKGKQQPRFPMELRDDLRERLEDRLAPLLDAIDSAEYRERDLHLTKFKLTQVLSCERKFLASREQPFEWSVPTARGTVSHKAVELSVHWRGRPAPLVLVDEAIASLSDSDAGISDFLQACSDAERAELRSTVGATIEQFLECFPPLKREWRPATESPIRTRLHGDRIVLSGKPDLTLGRAEGGVSGKVVIDFKTGSVSPAHVEDLRFYALVEALRILPPRLVATYYLDEARARAEEVTREMLESALERVVDGAFRYVALVTAARAPTVLAGPACRWCPVQADCETGTSYLNDRADKAQDDW